jgi:uncharacterized membrane-anchored protein
VTNTRLKAAVLGLLSVAQLTAAGWSIARYESTLRSGTLYRIRVEPVDPADAFRGRYVAVRPSIRIPEPIDLETRQLLDRIQNRDEGYVVLGSDADGFARVSAVLMAPPARGDYLKVAYAWDLMLRAAQVDQAGTTGGYVVAFSFDRYYMNERAAPAAEQQFVEAAGRNSSRRAWLAVRVKDGVGVIESLFIDGVELK